LNTWNLITVVSNIIITFYETEEWILVNIIDCFITNYCKNKKIVCAVLSEIFTSLLHPPPIITGLYFCGLSCVIFQSLRFTRDWNNLMIKFKTYNWKLFLFNTNLVRLKYGDNTRDLLTTYCKSLVFEGMPTLGRRAIGCGKLGAGLLGAMTIECKTIWSE